MPAGYSQKSAAQRAERQFTAGYTYVGGDSSSYYVTDGGIVKRRIPLGPSLPDLAPGGADWTIEARDWYYDFRTSPQAELLRTEADWSMLVLAASLLNHYFTTGNLQAFTKFEALVSKFGVTPGDRKKSRIGISTPNDEEAEELDDAEQAEELDDEFAALMAQRPVN